MKTILSVLALFCLASSALFAAPPVTPAPEGSATRAIQDLDNMLDDYILRPRTPEQKKFNAELKRKVLSGTFDIRELCRLSLDRHWKDLGHRQQDSFVELMTNLLERKAIFSKEHGSQKGSKEVYYVTYEGEFALNPEGSSSRVQTLVRIPSEDMKISLDYKLMKAGTVWKIFDVIVDGASLAENYKYQFDRIIAQHGYEDLVRRMQSKLDEIELKEGGKVAPKESLSLPPTQGEKKSRWGCTLILP